MDIIMAHIIIPFIWFQIQGIKVPKILIHRWVKHVSRYLTQLGEASFEEAHQVCFFSLSLSGLAFTWFSSFLVNSIANWTDLEKKFHTYFYIETGEKKITDLTTIRQRTNESGTKFLQRFWEIRNLCFSLNLIDDQLAALAVQGMLPT